MECTIRKQFKARLAIDWPRADSKTCNVTLMQLIFGLSYASRY